MTESLHQLMSGGRQPEGQPVGSGQRNPQTPTEGPGRPPAQPEKPRDSAHMGFRVSLQERAQVRALTTALGYGNYSELFRDLLRLAVIDHGVGKAAPKDRLAAYDRASKG